MSKPITKLENGLTIKFLVKEKKYVIKYQQICSQGFVKIGLFSKSQENSIENEQEGLNFATKFRYRWVAATLCSMFNKIATYELSLKHFYIQEV
jgi:hypothetical protein